MGENQGPITLNEMIEMFGTKMPMEAASLVWDSSPDRTVGEIRAELRRLADRKAAIMRVARAIVDAEQDQWVTPAKDWDFDAFEMQGVWAVAVAAYDAAHEAPSLPRNPMIAEGE